MNILLNIGLSLLVMLTSLVGVYNYLPLSVLEYLNTQKHKLGATITTIAGTDTLSSSRTTINDNFTNLNSGKTEVSSSSIAAITTLANLTSAASLATVGTITSGTWTGSVIDVARQGTGTTSPSLYRVILGNAANGLTVASGTGSTGQFLTSNGSGAYPSWQTSAVDQGINYTWTGIHGFGSSTPAARVGIQGNAWVSGTMNAGNLNATSTLTVGSVSGSVGIGTTTPAAPLAVQGDAFISGTTTTGTLVATSSIWIGSTKSLQSYAYSSSTALLSTGTYDDTRTLNFTPKALTGSAFFTANTNSPLACSFAWTSALGNVHISALTSTGSGGGDTTNLCKGDQASDDARIFVQSSGVGTITFRLIIGAGASTLNNISAVITGD